MGAGGQHTRRTGPGRSPRHLPHKVSTGTRMNRRWRERDLEGDQGHRQAGGGGLEARQSGCLTSKNGNEKGHRGMCSCFWEVRSSHCTPATTPLYQWVCIG